MNVFVVGAAVRLAVVVVGVEKENKDDDAVVGAAGAG